ncbi:MAG TPA: response regulator transcription factor [Anaerolineaceae bacterium]|mgnify:CR=1 FL=1|jgi:DNA-binding response OmpR family regulator|nr:response regulator transcription factor [Anaerolineaceae bacterium]NMC17421.1 response regulator transcription factor [Chloroflexota bacterium]HNR00922.1 response regulator transcription factor [Anaerolineaceae bacterium]HNS06562.1 response regulator transcription factor [Anaerolineaceae bacterium]
MTTILIIEDEVTLARILQSYLEREGYHVLSAQRGDTGLDLCLSENVDLVLLDLNLPGMDGVDVATEVLREKDIPIIMVTARVEEIDRLKGLELGADDYITKPFSPREVLARVKTVLRRVNRSRVEEDRFLIPPFEIDIDAHLVKKAGQEIDLTPSEFAILVTLARHPGRVFSRLQLLEATQGQSFEGYERTVDAHIKNLRAKIEEDARKPAFIKTVFGVGYKFYREDE